MYEFSAFEHCVRQRITAKWAALRVALILFYVLFVVAAFTAGLFVRIAWPLFALVPLLLWILVFVTWRYTDIEYEYTITSGKLTFCKIYGNRTRKRMFEMDLRDAVLIAPLDGGTYSARATAYRPERSFEGVSSFHAPNIYMLLFELDARKRADKRRAIFYFEATSKSLSICRFYNQSATVTTALSS